VPGVDALVGELHRELIVLRQGGILAAGFPELAMSSLIDCPDGSGAKRRASTLPECRPQEYDGVDARDFVFVAEGDAAGREGNCKTGANAFFADNLVSGAVQLQTDGLALRMCEEDCVDDIPDLC
jgi:hypothetical protein